MSKLELLFQILNDTTTNDTNSNDSTLIAQRFKEPPMLEPKSRLRFFGFSTLFCCLLISTDFRHRLAAEDFKDLELRLWTDSQGNQVTARLTRYKEGILYLRTNRRQTIQSNPGAISEKDRLYVIELLERSGKKNLLEEFKRLAEARVNRNNSAQGGSGSAMTPGAGGGGRMNGPRSGGNGFRGNGSAGPGTTPAGDSPVASGGGSATGVGRAPSPYVRSPDDERESLEINPGGGDRKLEPSFNPFTEAAGSSTAKAPGKKEPERFLGNPSEALKPRRDPPKSSRSGEESRKEDDERTRMNPFAEYNENQSKGGTSQNQNNEASPAFFDSESDQGYQPPVLLNKESASPEKAEPTAAGFSGSIGLLFIALGVVALLLMITIGLLIAVLSKNSKGSRRSYSN